MNTPPTPQGHKTLTHDIGKSIQEQAKIRQMFEERKMLAIRKKKEKEEEKEEGQSAPEVLAAVDLPALQIPRQHVYQEIEEIIEAEPSEMEIQQSHQKQERLTKSKRVREEIEKTKQKIRKKPFDLFLQDWKTSNSELIEETQMSPKVQREMASEAYKQLTKEDKKQYELRASEIQAEEQAVTHIAALKGSPRSNENRAALKSSPKAAQRPLKKHKAISSYEDITFF